MRLVGLSLTLLLATAILGQEGPVSPDTERLPGLKIEQESNGIPGRQGDETTIQKLIVTRDRLQLFDPDSGLTYLFRLDLDPPRIYELAWDMTQYRDVDKLNKTQEDRDRWEAQLLASRSQMSKADFEEHLRRKHLRADGKRVVTVDVEPHPEPVLEMAVKKYVVRENGRVIVDALITTDLDPLTIPFFEFYRRVGAFSEEVLSKLKEIHGVPLTAEITVVTANLNYTIVARVKNLQPYSFLPADFELPANAKEVLETPFAPCVMCGRQVEKKMGIRVVAPGQEGYSYCCSKECKRDFRKKYQPGLGKGDGN